MYAGTAEIVLPGLTKTAVSGSLTFANGDFTAGFLKVDNLNRPIGGSVFVQSLGAELDTNPWMISGSVGLSAGPAFDKASLLGLVGNLAYTFSENGSPSKYELSGKLSVGGEEVGSGDITLSDDTGTVSIHIGAGLGSDGLHLGALVKMTGSASGSFSSSSFSVTGTASFTVLDYSISGTVVMNDHGIAACGTYDKSSYGFTWVWGQAPATQLGDCTTNGF